MDPRHGAAQPVDLAAARARRDGSSIRRRIAATLRHTADVLDDGRAAREPTAGFLILVGEGEPEVIPLGDIRPEQARAATTDLIDWATRHGAWPGAGRRTAREVRSGP